MKLNWRTFKWLAIVGSLPPLYFHLRALILDEYVTTNTANDFIFWLLVSIFVTIVLSVAVFIEIEWLQKVSPWKKNVAKRILAEALLTFFTVMVGMLILSKFTFGMHCKMFPEKLTYTHHLFEELTTGMVLWAILISVKEGVYFFNLWKDELVLSQILQKEKVESQLEALRNQANPHFLFNSLNTLSSLVHSDPEKAEEFINQFASVYRYVLNIQDKNVVTLRDELEFLKSYLFLQKIRFSEGLNYKIDIEEYLKDYFIVPYSLQILVENAIKHNIVSRENSLNIHIYIDNLKVYVKNNIQLREEDISSNGLGLSNLRKRYFHLAGIMPEISQSDKEFIVSIPLLKPEKKEENKKNDHDECCNHRRRKFRGRKT